MRKHRVLDRPVISIVLLILLGFALNIILQIPGAVMGLKAGNDGHSIYTMIISALQLLITELLFTGLMFRNEFTGTLRGRIGLGFKLLLPIVALDIISFAADRLYYPDNSLNSVLWVLSLSFAAGVTEELIFRSLTLANLMRVWHTRGRMMAGVLITSMVFGLVHLSNISLAGAELWNTVVQAGSAVCFGIFISAVYLRCGSILPCMFYHFYHDVLSMLFMKMTEAGGIAEKFTSFSLAENLIFDVILLIWGLYLLRKSKYEEIREIWDEKWHIAAEPQAITEPENC